jgi:hypothetical protein
MSTIHAWFSFETALRAGSAVYGRPTGSGTVNVTRLSTDRDGKGSFPRDEVYLGEVLAEQDGGCVRGTRRVPGISG